MEYMIISMLTISIFTCVVYMLANKILAIQMHIKFLVLCAFCAFSMSLILPRLFVGVVGLSGTFCIIILFGLISSYFIARYYDAELGKAPSKSTLIPISVEIPETTEPEQQDFLPTILSFKTVHELAKNLEIATEPSIKESKEFFVPVSFTEKNEDWQIGKDKNIVQLPIKEDVPAQSEEAEITNELIVSNNETEIEETIEETKVEPQERSLLDENLIMELADPEVIPEEIVDQELYPSSTDLDVSNELITLENKEEIEVTIIEETKVECLESSLLLEENLVMQLPDTEVIPEEIVDQELYPSSTDLDVLMDIAFLQKEQKKFSQALVTFRRALFLYPNSEVSPFLVIEIGAILKNNGLYNEAIQVFTEGRLLPAVMNNASLEHEFINNVAYLRVVKNILIKNSLEFTPLNQLSSDTLKEIDDEFCEWRSQSS